MPVTRLNGEQAVRVLGATALFTALDTTALNRLATRCDQRGYGRGQYLCYQGDPGDRLFVIAEGLLKVVLTSERGDEVVLTTLGSNESLGELSILDGGPRSASVVAVEPTQVLMLTRRTLLDVMAQHPVVLDAMLRSLGGLVRRLTEQAGGFVLLDLGGRLAKVLLRLRESHAGESGERVLDLHLSQSDLAAMVGASRPAVTAPCNCWPDAAGSGSTGKSSSSSTRRRCAGARAAERPDGGAADRCAAHRIAVIEMTAGLSAG